MGFSLLKFSSQNFEIAYEMTGTTDGPMVLWAHGWGQTGAAFRPLAQSFEKSGRHYLIDFPGFGNSPPPSSIWGTEQYADALATFIESEIKEPVIWAGHSFGCRVGLQIAARRPDLIKGLFLISAAGLKRKRPLLKKIYMTARIILFKSLKKLIPHGLINESWLYKTFGSADYKAAGPMRSIFVKTVNQDLSDIAKTVKCPVMLVYGSNDTETPPEIGRRLNKLIASSEYIELPGLDHYTILGTGRHQTAAVLKNFIKKLS